MREFLHSFFNPQQLVKTTAMKKKVYKRRKKKTGPTPIQMQLDEAFEYLKFSLNKFEELMSGDFQSFLCVCGVFLGFQI